MNRERIVKNWILVKKSPREFNLIAKSTYPSKYLTENINVFYPKNSNLTYPTFMRSSPVSNSLSQKNDPVDPKLLESTEITTLIDTLFADALMRNETTVEELVTLRRGLAETSYDTIARCLFRALRDTINDDAADFHPII